MDYNCSMVVSVSRKHEWRVDLAETDPTLLAQAAQFTARGLHWNEYLRVAQMVDLATLRTRLTRMLYDEYRVALLRIPPELSDDTLRLLVLLVGRALGKNVTPSVETKARPLFAITATPDPTIGGRYGGNG
ncbi:MAG TPA: hypothetical protein VFP64_06325, partial [Pyrinomonadaceae bacterium]|nr:hypothetical protein [Pyrinomonadaceae bacterium]